MSPSKGALRGHDVYAVYAYAGLLLLFLSFVLLEKNERTKGGGDGSAKFNTV